MGLFGKKTVATKETEEHNPYLDGRREWLERYGSYIQRARQWRFMALAALLLAGISVTGNVLQATQSKMVPYIIEVDKIGKAAVATRADEAASPPMRQPVLPTGAPSRLTQSFRKR